MIFWGGSRLEVAKKSLKASENGFFIILNKFWEKFLKFWIEISHEMWFCDGFSGGSIPVVTMGARKKSPRASQNDFSVILKNFVREWGPEYAGCSQKIGQKVSQKFYFVIFNILRKNSVSFGLKFSKEREFFTVFWRRPSSGVTRAHKNISQSFSIQFFRHSEQILGKILSVLDLKCHGRNFWRFCERVGPRSCEGPWKNCQRGTRGKIFFEPKIKISPKVA